MEWITVTIASLFAGFVDAVVGGGGLILTPALFSTFPAAMPATLLGTNKSASVWGTSFATWQYQRRVQMHWQAILPAALCGLAGSFAGAWAVTQMSPHFLRKALPLVLVLILLYTLVKKDLGRHHAPRFSGHKEVIAASLIGGCIGLYDGFLALARAAFWCFCLCACWGMTFCTLQRAPSWLMSLPILQPLPCLPARGMYGGIWGWLWQLPMWQAV